MYALTFLVAAISMVSAAPSTDFEVRQVAAVASVDRYSGGGCTGTICNKAGSGDLKAGCNAITGTCQASLRLNYANAGCKGKSRSMRCGMSMTDKWLVAIWKDALCKDATQFANVTDSSCFALGPPILGISVTC